MRDASADEPSGSPERNRRESYRSRLRIYDRRVGMATRVGAAMVALVALVAGVFAGGILREAPRVFGPLIVTAFFTTGLCLAMAYIKFEYAGTLIRRQVEDGEVKWEDPLPSEQQRFPAGVEAADRWWVATLYLIVLTGALFLIAVWWSFVSGLSGPTPGVPPTPQPSPTAHSGV
jgi:hypothetical protein